MPGVHSREGRTMLRPPSPAVGTFFESRMYVYPITSGHLPRRSENLHSHKNLCMTVHNNSIPRLPSNWSAILPPIKRNGRAGPCNPHAAQSPSRKKSSRSKVKGRTLCIVSKRQNCREGGPGVSEGRLWLCCYINP